MVNVDAKEHMIITFYREFMQKKSANKRAAKQIIAAAAVAAEKMVEHELKWE